MRIRGLREDRALKRALRRYFIHIYLEARRARKMRGRSNSDIGLPKLF